MIKRSDSRHALRASAIALACSLAGASALAQVPAALTRELQFALAGFVVLVNLAVYAWVWRRKLRQGSTGACARRARAP